MVNEFDGNGHQNGVPQPMFQNRDNFLFVTPITDTVVVEVEGQSGPERQGRLQNCPPGTANKSKNKGSLVYSRSW